MGSIYHAGQEVTNISISGEGYNIVIETTDSELYGETVTIKQNGTVIGTTTFDNEGHAEYKVSQAGTYIVSVTYEGTESTKEVTVSDASVDINVRLSLSSWLVAGGVDPSDYPTFEDLGEETIRRLMLVHNAVDYIASAKEGDTLMETIIRNMECAKWINLCDYAQDEFEKNEAIKAIMDEVGLYGYGEIAPVGKVPTMTSNTAPSGVASASNEYIPAWKAFDADTTDNGTWHTNVSFGSEVWIQYQSVKPICVNHMTIIWDSRIASSKCKLVGSNDGTNWEDILSYTTLTVSNRTNVVKIPNNNIRYLYHRLYIKEQTTSSSVSYAGQIASLQFYEYQPIGNVPIMTANNAPYGVASCSTDYSASYTAYKAFDGVNSNSSSWQSADNTNAGYVVYEFANPICPKKVAFEPPNNGASQPYVKDWEVRGSNDGTQWSDPLASGTVAIPYPIGTLTEEQVTCSTYYKYLKFNITGTYAPHGNVGLTVLQFYGRELKPLVPIPTMTSNTTPYGVASETGATEGQAYYLFDGNDSTRLYKNNITSAADALNVDFEFNEPTFIDTASIRFGTSSTHYAGVINLYGYDGEWEQIGAVSYTKTESTSPIVKSFTFSKKGIYEKVRYSAPAQARDDSGYSAPALYEATCTGYGMDYSEKEFAQGSKRKTIYDHGVELEDVTVYTEGTGSKATKEADCINLSISASTHVSACVYANIDLTDYNVLGVKIGRTHADGSYLSVYSQIPNYAQTGRQATKFSSEPMKTLDISNLNNSYYVTSQCANNNSGGAGSADVAELWLE